MTQQQKREKTSSDEQFPSSILYTSPDAVSSLSAWVQDVDRQQTRNDNESNGK